MDQQAQQAANTGQEPVLDGAGNYPDSGGILITYINPLEADYYFSHQALLAKSEAIRR